MAEQVYIYGAAQGVRPASYSYGGYASGDSAQVGAQPVYGVSVQQPGQSYSYEPSGYAASSLAGAPTAGYAQSELGQPQYAVQVVAATQSSAYGSSQAASYTAVPGASPYGTTQAVVTPGAYAAPSGEQQYAQPAYGQPSYAQQQQPSAAYIQQPQAQHVQVQVQPPTAQPATAYGIAAAQQTYAQPPVIAAGQPAGTAYAQQPPAQPGQIAGQQTVVYGQPPTQPGVAPSYGQPQQAPAYAPPVAQAGAATAYAQTAPGQAAVYGQPPVQPAAISQLPPPQQTAVYMVPAAAAPQPSPYTIPPPSQQPPVAAYRPAVSGRPVSPVDLVPYDQRPLNIPPAGGRGPPPAALLGPSVVLNAVLGGPRGGGPSFGHAGRDVTPGRGYGGLDRNDIGNSDAFLDDTVFIKGLPETVTEELLAKHFSSVGSVKRDARGKPRVWICRDKETGRPRGDGIVGYDLPQAASLAIERFHRSEFLGARINVRHAAKKPPGQQQQLPPRGKDDWICVVGNCGNHNFAWRTECNRCKAPRPAPADKEGAADGLAAADGDVDGRTSPRSIPRGGRTGPGGRGRGGAMDRNTRGGPMMRGRFERRNQPY